MLKVRAIVILLWLMIASSAIAEEQEISMLANSAVPLKIGHVAKIDFVLKNSLQRPVLFLEIQPDQPCEDPINLVHTLYGEIRYLEKYDQYLYDSLPQAASMIPVVEGFIGPGEELTVSVPYRPFDQKENFTINYALVGDQKVYFRKETDGKESRFSTDGKDHAQVIVPALVNIAKLKSKIQIVFRDIQGEPNSLCYCETLSNYQVAPPYSLCKDWDLGQTVQIRVGEKQEGKGPQERSAGWKFLDTFPVFYGDGMYTHGEFLKISPDEAPSFMKKIDGKFSLKRLDYFFAEHYYDLESLE